MPSPILDSRGNPYSGRRAVRPTETLGQPGFAVYGGYLQENETSPELANRSARQKAYADILANTAIVAAGVRYFLNLIGSAGWSFSPSEADGSGEYAERVEEMLTADPDTSWHRVVRRASLYRFYGFGLQEWTAKRREDGALTFADIAPRSQATIERWDVEPDGKVRGAVQRSPQTHQDIYLPRQKLLYLVDDSLNSTPEGFGLFRHLIAPAKRLKRYEQLEGFGFEADLRGIPVGYAPVTALDEAVENGDLTAEVKDKALKNMEDFLKKHIRTPELSLLLDSQVYTTLDEMGRPSSVKQWAVELLRGDIKSFAEHAAAVERLNRELARILGVEHLLLGSNSTGSFALSEDKTHAFFLLVDSALTEIREAVEKDLIEILFILNGWPDEMMPEVATQPVQFRDVAKVLAGLRDLAAAGAPLTINDITIINEALDLLGLSPRDEETIALLQEEEALMREAQRQAQQGQGMNDDDPVPPRNEGGNGNE